MLKVSTVSETLQESDPGLIRLILSCLEFRYELYNLHEVQKKLDTIRSYGIVIHLAVRIVYRNCTGLLW
jgi:hypothetical protein